MIKKLFVYLAVVIGATLFIGASAHADDCVPIGLAPPPPSDASCSSILPNSWCKSNGVWEITNLVFNIATMGVGILATLGIVIVGIQWLTAKDNEQQVAKSKNRLLNIVIGVLVWGLMWLIASWLIPRGIVTTGLMDLQKQQREQPRICEPGEEPGGGSTTTDPDNPNSPNTNNPPTSTPTQSAFPVGNPLSNSESIACDPRTRDLGVHYAYNNGRPVKYRFCSIPNLPSTTTDGYESLLRAAGKMNLNGYAVVNSRVSGAVFAMVEAAKADGVTLRAGSTYRTVEWQMSSCKFSSAQKQQLYDETAAGKQVTKRCPDTNDVYKMKAAPGYSLHQTGVAIDFKSNGYSWLRANSTRFGYANYDKEEWHYDTNCSSSRRWGSNKPAFCS